jgi:hypothetical protein
VASGIGSNRDLVTSAASGTPTGGLGNGPGSDGTHLRSAFCSRAVSEFAKGEGSASEERNTLSVPWVIAAAILCGVGIFFVTGALVRLAGGLNDWSWWIGIAPATLGFFMLLNPRAGSQGPH